MLWALSETPAWSTGILPVSKQPRRLFSITKHGAQASCLGLVPQSGKRLLARPFKAGRGMTASFMAKASQSDARTRRQDNAVRSERKATCSRVALRHPFRRLTLNALTGLERPGYHSAAALRQRGSEQITKPPRKASNEHLSEGSITL